MSKVTNLFDPSKIFFKSHSTPTSSNGQCCSLTFCLFQPMSYDFSTWNITKFIVHVKVRSYPLLGKVGVKIGVTDRIGSFYHVSFVVQLSSCL